MIAFQLILNPIRDWNMDFTWDEEKSKLFQLILNPIRDWNHEGYQIERNDGTVPINLKPY